MTVYEFAAVLVKPAAVGAWTFVTVPLDVEEHFGRKAQVRVKGTINGIAYQSSLMPHGDGTHFMVVSQALREAAGVAAGSTVSVTMERDDEARVVQVPEDFALQLEANEAAGAIFGKLSYSHQKEYVSWIEEAKKAETRIGRIGKAIEKLTEGRKLK